MISLDDAMAALIRVVQRINPDDEGSKEDRSTLAEFLKQYVDSHPTVVERSDTKEKPSASQRSR